MVKNLREIAQNLAELHLESYDFINIAEQQDDLGLTDDEIEEVWEMITEGTVTI